MGSELTVSDHGKNYTRSFSADKFKDSGKNPGKIKENRIQHLPTGRTQSCQVQSCSSPMQVCFNAQAQQTVNPN
jgi:hypothetical protein